MKKHFILLAVAIFCFANLSAQTQPLNTQSISIFKNGQAFYLKSGALKPTNGKFLLPDPAPQALYGTLWFNSPEGSLSRVASYPDTLREQKTETNIVTSYDLLRNNIGKTATAFIDDKNTVTGKIISVSPAYKNEKDEPQYNQGSYVTFQMQQGWTTIPAGQIRYVTFQEQPKLELSEPKVKLTPRHLIELSFNNKKGEQPFDMMYLAYGLNWAPQYLLELTGESIGSLSLQGEVANDTEDIVNTNLNLVVGVPNFAYAKRLSYLVDFLEVILPYQFNTRNTLASFTTNALAAQQVNYGGDATTFTGPEELETSRNEDLYFYTLKNFSLPKGGRSIESLFKEKVNVAHIYECKLPDYNDNNQYYEQEFLFTPLVNKVYHTLRLENKTNQPWTTAPILVMNKQGDSRPISQDMMNYTPTGGKAFVKLTEAVDVKVEQAERETSRQSAALTDRRRGSFDLVQVEGKIKVKNFKDNQLDLRIQRSIVGKLKTTSTDWLKEEVINPNNPRNRKTNVCWETPIKANSELEIVYTYEIYVSSY